MVDALSPLPASGKQWPLWLMIVLTVIYIVPGLLSIYIGLIGFMCFDAGVNNQALLMFCLGWLPFLGFVFGIPLAWWGYRIKLRRLTMIGFGLPFIGLFLIGVCAVILTYI